MDLNSPNNNSTKPVSVDLSNSNLNNVLLVTAPNAQMQSVHLQQSQQSTSLELSEEAQRNIANEAHKILMRKTRREIKKIF